MADMSLRTASKKQANSTDKEVSEVVKSEYWLNNLETPFGSINVNLVTGLKGQTGVTMEKILKGVTSKGVDYTNEYFKNKGLNCYVTQEGVKSSPDLPSDF